MNTIRRAAARLALMLCVLMLAGCSNGNGAENRVKAELDALKTSDYVGRELTDLRASLSDEGKENFDGFVKKVRDFDYEITGSKEDDDPDDNYTEVSVKIKTCDFGTEYLATWTEYIKEHGDSLNKDDELTDFYELLFARLAALEEKDCIKSVEITCVDPVDNDEWIANIKDNEDLQDAIFGGMLSEMKTLAAD